jgi:hypothetical protein
MIMRDAWADDIEGHLRSRACVRAAHHGCPHVEGGGAGFNPRRRRFEAGETLCKCECHSSCPLASDRLMVSERAWRESCSCPGAVEDRPRRERARAEALRSSQARDEALAAVRARAAGMSGDEIRDLYVAELEARGLDVPPENILDAYVSLVTGDDLASARFFGRSLVGLAKLVGLVTRPRTYCPRLGRGRRYPPA